MDQAGWCGVGVGLFAALLQHLHVVRSIRKRSLKAERRSVLWALGGSLSRLTMLAAIFLVAGLWDRIRVDTGVLTFAGAHLLGMLYLGMRISTGAFEPPR